MGSFGLNAYSGKDIERINKEILAQTNKPYALNLWVPKKEEVGAEELQLEWTKNYFRPYFEAFDLRVPNEVNSKKVKFEEQVEAVLEANPPVVSFIFGLPEKELLSEFRKRGITVIGSATSLEEGINLEEAKVDMVVASGKEAGGHRPTFLTGKEDAQIGTQLLVQQLTQNLKIPVIAAGGISTPRDMKSVFSLGASAVQMGTAFLATKESGAPPPHKEALLSKNSFQTALTKVYTGRWARAMLNEFVEDFRDYNEMALPFPFQSNFISAIRKAALKDNKTQYLAFWAGQPSSTLRFTNTSDLFHSLVQGME